MAAAGPANLTEDPLAEMTNVTPASAPSFATEQLSTRYNMRSPAVKRILREAAEMAQHDRTILFARPLDDNIFEWHFTFRGPPDTVFHRGVYHGRLILPSQYPMSPPDIVMITPSGRFDTGNKICLSISNYHPESWQPSWSIRTALTALRSFMATNCPGAIGSIDSPDAARTQLAINSSRYECGECGVIGNILEPEPLEAQGLSEPAGNPTSPYPISSEETLPGKSKSEPEANPIIEVANETHFRGRKGDTNTTEDNADPAIRENGLRRVRAEPITTITNQPNQTGKRKETDLGKLDGDRNSSQESSHQSNFSDKEMQRLAAKERTLLNYAMAFVLFLIIGIILRRALMYDW